MHANVSKSMLKQHTHKFKFLNLLVGGLHLKVAMRNTKRLCSSKPIVIVNKRFPGPTLYAREGDTVLIKVVNHVKYNLSIHW